MGQKRDERTNAHRQVGQKRDERTNGRTHRGKKGDIIHTYIHHTNGKLFSKVGYSKEQKHFKDKLDLKSLKQHCVPMETSSRFGSGQWINKA